MKDPKTLWAWIGGAIIIVAVIGGVAWYYYGGTPSAPPGIVAVHAPAGQLVPGFPKELVAVDTAAQLSDSYSVNYSSSTDQYTAEWSSSSSITSLYASYLAYGKTNNWTITNQADYPTLKAVYATTASAKISINLSAQGKGAKVSMTYVVIK